MDMSLAFEKCTYFWIIPSLSSFFTSVSYFKFITYYFIFQHFYPFCDFKIMSQFIQRFSVHGDSTVYYTNFKLLHYKQFLCLHSTSIFSILTKHTYLKTAVMKDINAFQELCLFISYNVKCTSISFKS